MARSPDGGDRLPRRRIGDILISEAVITEGQLEEALEVQKTDKRNIGDILVSLGYLKHDDLARVLSRRLNVEYEALSEDQVDPDVLGIISEDVLRRYKAFPLRVETGRLVVAMSDPNDTHARSDITISAGYPVKPVVASEEAIRRLQEKTFGSEERVATGITGAQEKGATNPRDARRAERVEPGGQPEVDLGEPVLSSEARDYSIEAAREYEVEREGAGQPIGEGGLDPGRARRAVGAGRIGEILVSEAKITAEQLEQALAIQSNDPRDLGRILLSLGFVTPADLAQALAKRLKLHYVVISDLSEDDVDPTVLDLLGEETIRKYKALPLRFEDGGLVVAMSDPNDIYALEDLRIITKHPIRPVVATEEDLEGTFAHLFGADEGGYSKAPVEEPTEEPAAEVDPTGPELAEPENEPLSDVDDLSGKESEEAGDETIDAEQVRTESGDDDNNAVTGVLQRRIEELRGKKVAIGSGRIGDILVAEGKVTEEQLERALAMQKYDPREIGKILLSLGYVSKVGLAQALAKRLRLDFVEITDRDVERGAVSLVEQKVLRKYEVVPLRLENGRLVVAMSDPTNIHALEDLMMISGYPVTPVVAVEEEIQRVLNKLFAMTEDVSEFLEEAGKEPVEEDYGELELGMGASPDEAPIIRLVSSILRQAVGDGASDIHIEPQARQVAVRMRVDGVLREVMTIPPKLKSGVIARLKIVGSLDIAERRVPQDGRFSVKLGGHKVDLRVASLPTVYGEKVVLRLLDTSNAAVELTELGFHPKVYEQYEEIFRRPYGTILVTGPTGSGKSTTLYGTLNELNSPEKNIITVEDPVEYRMQGINQIQTNPKAGLTFASALRSILRADPDIMMIGEIRDFETAKIAVEAALTGHLVLTMFQKH